MPHFLKQLDFFSNLGNLKNNTRGIAWFEQNQQYTSDRNAKRLDDLEVLCWIVQAQPTSNRKNPGEDGVPRDNENEKVWDDA